MENGGKKVFYTVRVYKPESQTGELMAWAWAASKVMWECLEQKCSKKTIKLSFKLSFLIPRI